MKDIFTRNQMFIKTGDDPKSKIITVVSTNDETEALNEHAKTSIKKLQDSIVKNEDIQIKTAENN